MLRKYFLLRWFLLLFTLSASASVVPCCVVNSLGLFGEVNASAVTQVQEEETAEIAEKAHRGSKSVKGINIFNTWFLLFVLVLYVSFIKYEFRLLRKITIVTLKVRMDN